MKRHWKWTSSSCIFQSFCLGSANMLVYFSQCVSVCVCVCTRARIYVYVCMNVTNENNVIIATCTTQYRVLTKLQKFINWTFKKFVTYTWRKFLPVNVVYIKTVIKTHSYRHFHLTFSCQVVTKGHKNLNKPAAKICRFV